MSASLKAIGSLLLTGLLTVIGFLGSCAFKAKVDTRSSFYVKGPEHDKVIIFVHGLFGSHEFTWSNRENGAYWPQLIAEDPEFQNFDVYVVTYKSPYLKKASTIEEISARLLQQLKDSVLKNHSEVYVISHSMGGLIVKRMLTTLNRLNRDELENLDRFRAIVYLSTPSQGSTLAEMASWISMNPQMRDLAAADLNSFLQGLENQWEHLLRDRDELGMQLPKCFVAYETQNTIGLNIVSRIYAVTRCDLTPYPVDMNHDSISKPHSKQHEIYLWVKHRFLETSGIPHESRIVKFIEKASQPKKLALELSRDNLFGLTPLQFSPAAKALGAQIPIDAHAYQKALKAFSEGKFEEVKIHLGQAERTGHLQIAKVYTLRGRAEMFSGSYAEAIKWYEKAIQLQPEDMSLMNEKAIALTYDGRYQEAEPILQNVLTVLENEFGRDNDNVAPVLNNLATVSVAQGRYDNAITLWERLFGIVSKQLESARAHNIGPVTDNLAQVYIIQAKYSRAEQLYDQALHVVENGLGSNSPDIGHLLNGRGRVYRLKGEYKKAEAAYRASLSILEKSLGPYDPAVAAALNNMGELYYATEHYPEARRFYERANSIREKTLGRRHPRMATGLNNLAEIYRIEGKLSDAEALFKESLTILETKQGPGHPDQVFVLNNLAALYHDEAKFSMAEDLYKKARNIVETQLGSDHPMLAMVLVNLASLYYSEKRFMDAEQLLRQSIVILRASLGNEHDDTYKPIKMLAQMYYNEKRYAEAEPFYREAVEHSKRTLGAHNAAIAKDLNNLGNTYRDEGKYTEAESTFREAMALSEKELGKDHPRVAVSLNGLGTVYYALGRFEEAEEFHKRSLAIVEEKMPRDHTDIAVGLTCLARVYGAQNRDAEAEPLLRRALRIWENRLGRNNTIVADVSEMLAQSLSRLGRNEEAASLLRIAEDVRASLINAPPPQIKQ